MGTTLTTSRIANSNSSNGNKVSKAGLLSLTATKIKHLEDKRSTQLAKLGMLRENIHFINENVIAKYENRDMKGGSMPASMSSSMHTLQTVQQKRQGSGPSANVGGSNQSHQGNNNNNHHLSNSRIQKYLQKTFRQGIEHDWRYYTCINLMMKPFFDSFCKAVNASNSAHSAAPVESIITNMDKWAKATLTRKNFMGCARDEILEYSTSAAMSNVQPNVNELKQKVLNDVSLDELFRPKSQK